jgi:uncharacterized protein (TIGR02646 family)
MRYISKRDETPECLAKFIADQQGAGVNLCYNAFRDKRQLLEHLLQEQGGICAYTGVGLDDRLPKPSENTAFEAHIEHLKSQAECRRELKAQGKIFEQDLGEDLEYNNMAAALLVRAPHKEQFGASIRGDKRIPILPTHENCAARFQFDAGGRVRGRDEKDEDAEVTICVLKLDHATLNGWRRGAIQSWMDDLPASRDELSQQIETLNTPQNDRLAEFCFVIQSYLRSLLEA